MTITRKELTNADFWGALRICLDCGESEEVEIESCDACGGYSIISPQLALLVLNNVEAEDGEA